jgi:ABC-type bacteriocin/lantibiotic exporter with double-glycine peptidase domain
MLNFYGVIWNATWKQQILLVLLSATVAGLVAIPLKLQQLVVNELVYHKTLNELLLLCLGYLAVVLLNSVLKFLRDYKMRVLGENSVRRIRVRLYERHVADILEGRTHVPEKGTLLNMITTDAEDLGNFTGSAIAGPVLMIGTLISVIGFIFVQQPTLGIVALAIILPQALIVLVIQKRVNRGVKKRVQILRGASNSLHSSELKRIEQGILDEFDDIFETRRKIHILKMSSKFALRLINSIGVLAILFLGGWLVLEDRTDVGTVVAALTGMAQISGPWLELVAFFRNLSTMRVRFDMIANRVFAPRRVAADAG